MITVPFRPGSRARTVRRRKQIARDEPRAIDELGGIDNDKNKMPSFQRPVLPSQYIAITSAGATTRVSPIIRSRAIEMKRISRLARPSLPSPSLPLSSSSNLPAKILGVPSNRLKAWPRNMMHVISDDFNKFQKPGANESHTKRLPESRRRLAAPYHRSRLLESSFVSPGREFKAKGEVHRFAGFYEPRIPQDRHSSLLLFSVITRLSLLTIPASGAVYALKTRKSGAMISRSLPSFQDRSLTRLHGEEVPLSTTSVDKRVSEDVGPSIIGYARLQKPLIKLSEPSKKRASKDGDIVPSLFPHNGLIVYEMLLKESNVWARFPYAQIEAISRHSLDPFIYRMLSLIQLSSIHRGKGILQTFEKDVARGISAADLVSVIIRHAIASWRKTGQDKQARPSRSSDSKLLEDMVIHNVAFSGHPLVEILLGKARKLRHSIIVSMDQLTKLTGPGPDAAAFFPFPSRRTRVIQSSNFAGPRMSAVGRSTIPTQGQISMELGSKRVKGSTVSLSTQPSQYEKGAIYAPAYSSEGVPKANASSKSFVNARQQIEHVLASLGYISPNFLSYSKATLFSFSKYDRMLADFRMISNLQRLLPLVTLYSKVNETILLQRGKVPHLSMRMVRSKFPINQVEVSKKSVYQYEDILTGLSEPLELLPKAITRSRARVSRKRQRRSNLDYHLSPNDSYSPPDFKLDTNNNDVIAIVPHRNRKSKEIVREILSLEYKLWGENVNLAGVDINFDTENYRSMVDRPNVGRAYEAPSEKREGKSSPDQMVQRGIVLAFIEELRRFGIRI